MPADFSRWRLREGWRVTDRDDELILSSGAEGFAVRGLKEDREATAAALRQAFPRPSAGRAGPIHIDLFDQLNRLGLIVPVAASDAEWRDSRLSGYLEHSGLNPVVARRRLAAARVLILGLGGTGSVVLQHLVGACVGDFVLVDCDVVQEVDLERQFVFRVADIGRPKVAVAAEYVLERRPATALRVIEAEVIDPAALTNLIGEHGPLDAAVICIDHPPDTAFAMTSTALWEADVPFVHGGVMLEGGFYGPFFHRQAGSLPPSAFPLWRPEFASEAEPTACCFPPYNTVIGAYLAAEVLRFLSGLGSGVRFDVRSFVDFRDDRLRKVGAAAIGIDRCRPN